MKRTFILFLLMLIAATALAQDTRVGLPVFGSFDTTPYDVVNRQNLNTHVTIPIATVPGRGFPFQLSVSYDSINWTPNGGLWSPDVALSGVPTWGWGRASTAGSISHQTRVIGCIYNGAHVDGTMVYNIAYTDSKGAVHPFSMSLSECGNSYTSLHGYSTDGAGYLISSTGPAIRVTMPSGIASSVTQVSDTNGNYVSSSGTNVMVWKDTRGNKVAVIDNSVAGLTQYEIIDQNGGNSTIYTLNYTQYYIQTSFGCSGVTEYTSSAPVWLPTSLVLPNGLSYTFSYEQPSGYASNYTTGRMASMTVPTGATYEYAYSGANGGINCADGTYTALTRTIVSDGTTNTWTFARSGSGSNWTTNITYPVMPYDSGSNADRYAFSGTHETSHSNYQGSSTLLQTVTTSWDSTSTFPTQITTTLPSGQHSDTVLTWTTHGQPSNLYTYDWTTSTSGFGTILKTINLAYQSNANPSYLTANLLSLVSQVTIGDTALRSVTQYTYDESGAVTSCPSGAPNHDYTNYGCSNGGAGSSASSTPRGLVTTAAVYSGVANNTATQPITAKYTYDLFGNVLTTSVKNWSLSTPVLQSTSVYSSTTQYSAPDSTVLGPVAPLLTTSYLYNPYTGMATQVTNPNGGVTQQTYDWGLRPLRTTRPDGQVVTASYNDSARTVTTTTPLDSSRTLMYESWANQLGINYQVESPVSTVQTLYDPLGRAYDVSNPFANGSSPSYWTSAKYDALGRALIVTTADGVSSTYSYSSSSSASLPYSVTATDGAGKQRLSVINGLGQITSLYEPDVTQPSLPLTVQTSYIYTALNSLLSIAQGAQTRTFAYDGLNRPTSVITPEGGTVQYSYDTCSVSSANICSRTDARGVVTNYTYDTLNRPYQVVYSVGSTGVPATPTVTYAYGTTAASVNNGHLIGVSDGLHSDSYTYDLMGDVLSVNQNLEGQAYTTQYKPNYAGQTTQLTYPSGLYLTLGYASDGTLNSINSSDGKVIASGLTHNPAGQLTNYTMGLAGGNVNATLGYSAQNLLLQSITYASQSNTLFGLGYGYTQNGGNNSQITSIVDYVQTGRSATFGYDALNRLTSYSTAGSSSYPANSMSWTYDRYGNRLTQVRNGSVQTLTPMSTSNRLSGLGYDANGNNTNDGTYSLLWDGDNRMISYASGGVTNEYDGNSLRVRRTGLSSDVVYVNSNGQPIAEYAPGAVGGNPSREYIYLGGQLLASKASGAYTFYLRDHLSIRQVLADASPNSPAEQGHLPFGESWYGGSGDKWIFTSYERDPDVGDDYASARRYQYKYGRFNSPDPLDGNLFNPQSWNRYAYTQNDPADWVDPTGQYAKGPSSSCTLQGSGGCAPGSSSDPTFSFTGSSGGISGYLNNDAFITFLSSITYFGEYRYPSADTTILSQDGSPLPDDSAATSPQYGFTTYIYGADYSYSTIWIAANDTATSSPNNLVSSNYIVTPTVNYKLNKLSCAFMSAGVNAGHNMQAAGKTAAGLGAGAGVVGTITGAPLFGFGAVYGAVGTVYGWAGQVYSGFWNGIRYMSTFNGQGGCQPYGS